MKRLDICTRCNHVIIHAEDVTHIDQTGPYCYDCSMVMVKCHNCGALYEATYKDNDDDDNYCDRCFNEIFTWCDDCGNSCLREELFTVDDRGVCPACFDSYKYCKKCENLYLPEDITDGYCYNCYPDG